MILELILVCFAAYGATRLVLDVIDIVWPIRA